MIDLTTAALIAKTACDAVGAFDKVFRALQTSSPKKNLPHRV
ncbi:hypothetical protein C7476_101654 [Phyllobacterium bourgognense]|uniref:Uncharacterized protein n=1 Tax=Phyllobacterium bourgognense TaxID=314236 RepID=A0A368Z604_9HYPH|nr:hypothetical protein C7476_101654 [Phyllobacterium bourgognense]